MALINFVQSRSTKGTNTLAFSSATTAGSLLAVFTSGYSGASPSAVTDTQGNTYISLPMCQSSVSSFWIALGTVGGANTVTATGLTGTGQGPYLIIAEYSIPVAGVCCYPVNFTKLNGDLRYTPNPMHISNETTLIFGHFYIHANNTFSGVGGVTVRETVADTVIATSTGFGDVNLASIASGSTIYSLDNASGSGTADIGGYTAGSVLAVSVLGSAMPGGVFVKSGSKLVGGGIYVS